MRSFVVVCVLFAMIGSAHAQAPGASPPVEPAPAPVSPAPPVPDAVSPGEALAISISGTLASYGVTVLGFKSSSGGLVLAGALGTLVMPSAGRWYGHSAAFGGLIVRAAGAGAMLAAFAIEFDDCFLSFGADSTCGKRSGEALTLATVGGLAYLGATVYDIVRAPSDARAYNDRRRAAPIAILPLVQPDQHRYGLVLATQF